MGLAIGRIVYDGGGSPMLGSALVRDPMFDAAARAIVAEDLVISSISFETRNESRLPNSAFFTQVPRIKISSYGGHVGGCSMALKYRLSSVAVQLEGLTHVRYPAKCRFRPDIAPRFLIGIVW